MRYYYTQNEKSENTQINYLFSINKPTPEKLSNKVNNVVELMLKRNKSLKEFETYLLGYLEDDFVNNKMTLRLTFNL